MGPGSYGSHWAEGTASGDSRQYYGNTYPGAPALQDELMTPFGEGAFDTPISKITLGAMSDLGWIVDTDQADNYEPLVHVIRYDSTNTYFEVKKNNFGGYKRAWAGGGSYTVFSQLRRGLTYRLYNDAGEALTIKTSGGSIITDGVSVGSLSGRDYIDWTVPHNISGAYIVISGSKPNANIAWTINSL